jgi:hypothetical protein
MQRILTIALILAAAGCGKEDLTGGDKPKHDPVAVAALRAKEQLRAMNDFKQIEIYYNLYRTEPGLPSIKGFLKYLEREQAKAPELVQAVKDKKYVVRIVSTRGLMVYEKDKDYQNTRVVLTPDGAVTKTMTEADFLAAVKKWK